MTDLRPLSARSPTAFAALIAHHVALWRKASPGLFAGGYRKGIGPGWELPRSLTGAEVEAKNETEGVGDE